MLDPNIRPSFISNESTFRARINSMIACADIVKVSDEDLDWILPGDESHHDKMLKLTTQGPSIVIMTRGKDGAKAITSQQQVVEVSSKLVEVVDTVGAGDTYNAGFLAKLSETNHLTKASLKSISVEALSEALAFGASVAAITVSRAGANPPWASEL